MPASAAEVAMLFEVHPLVIAHMVGRWVLPVLGCAGLCWAVLVIAHMVGRWVLPVLGCAGLCRGMHGSAGGCCLAGLRWAGHRAHGRQVGAACAVLCWS